MLAVLGALFANGIITILKFIAALITGSSGMMAESLHSFADTTNQVFLLLGLRFYKRPASEKHPFGYGKERAKHCQHRQVPSTCNESSAWIIAKNIVCGNGGEDEGQ